MDFRSPRRPLPQIQDWYNLKGLVSNRGDKKKAFFVLQKWYKEIQKGTTLFDNKPDDGNKNGTGSSNNNREAKPISDEFEVIEDINESTDDEDPFFSEDDVSKENNDFFNENIKK